MDLVYTLRLDDLSGNKQLINSLRSAEKHLRNYGRVFVVGCDPRLNNVTHIPYDDRNIKCAARNIANKLVIASMHPEVSQRFMYLADDHYLISDTDAETYPYYSNGTLEQHARRHTGEFKKLILNTERALSERGYETRNYNIHCPIIYDKEKVLKVYNAYNWDTGRGYIFKSLYCNTLGLYEGKELADCKVIRGCSETQIREKIEGKHVFSSAYEHKFTELESVLFKLFPKKSSYE